MKSKTKANKEFIIAKKDTKYIKSKEQLTLVIKS